MNIYRSKCDWRLVGVLLAAAALLAVLGLARAGVLAPPQVVDLQPDPGVHTAPVDSSVAITYDQDMDPLTVNPQSFAVHARLSGWLTETLSVVGGVISLDPVGSFHAGELVQVSATTATLSLGGEAPLAPTVWQFTTAPWGGNAAFHVKQLIYNSNSRDAALGDLDGDGDLDAFTTSCGGFTRVFHNDGSGAFIQVQIIDHSGTCLLDAELGDLDGDGDLDAVLIDNWMNGDKVLWNDGDGTFTDSGQSLGNFADTYAELGDLDGDGDLDLFVAAGGYGVGTLRVWKNDGTGRFTLASNIDTAYEHMDVALGDLDGDYDLDAFTTGWNNTYNKVWLNDGAGNFSEAQAIPNANTTGVQLGDLDGDGDLDAYLANTAFDSTDLPDEVWLNDGTGRFTDSGQRLGGVASAFPALGDLDADGDLDVYLSGDIAGNAPDEVWANDGTGTFTLFRTVDENQRGGLVTLGDLDGDGNLDAFVLGLFPLSGIQVYLNGDWTRAAPIPHITSLAAVIHCPDDPDGFYLLGGWELDDFRRYDAAADDWTELAPFPYPVYMPSAACYQGKIYAAAGSDLYIYDIASNTWTPGPPPPRLSMREGGMGAWNGALYVVGGYNPATGGPDGRISRYDVAAGTWELQIGVMPTPVWQAGWEQVGPYLYAAGGRKGPSVDAAETYRYDMSANTWIRGPDLASPRWATGLVATGSRLYALGGGYLMNIFVYDEVYYQELSTWPNSEWTDLNDPLPVAMGGMATACTEAVTGGEIWSAGGGYVDEDGVAHIFDTNLYYPAEACLGNTFTFDLDPETDAGEGNSGEQVVYTLVVTNTGDIPDAYSVEIVSTWSASAAEIDPLWPGESMALQITVNIPADALAGDADTAVVTITSQGDGTQEDAVTLTTTALAVYGVDLAAEVIQQSAYPGETVTYTLHVTNLGNITDTFDLSASGNLWQVTLPVTNVVLPVGGSLGVPVYVTVPGDASGGDADLATITAASRGDPAVTDAVTLTTTALPEHGVDLTGAVTEQSGFPGKVITYTLRLTNTGIVTDTVLITFSGNLWDVTLPITSVVLGAGEAVDLMVNVTVHINASLGEVDTVTITATSQGEPGLTASVTLNTAAWWLRSFLPLILK